MKKTEDRNERQGDSEQHNAFPMDRREFLRRAGKASALIGASGAVFGGLYEPSKSWARLEKDVRKKAPAFRPAWQKHTEADLVVAKGAARDVLADGIDAAGGIGSFVEKGSVVVIKPNAAWERKPELAANTSPDVISVLVKMCKGAGAKKVIVTDNACHEAKRAFDVSGIGAAAVDAGAEVYIPQKSSYVEMDLGGKMLGVWPVLKPVVQADVLINVPIVKHHTLAKLTACMKNLYGVVGGRRNRLHQDIDRGIAELGHAFRPVLNVVDATRVMVKNGPTGGSEDDIEKPGRILISKDAVAADAYACRYIHVRPEDVGYLSVAAQMGVGRHRLDSVKIVEVGA